MKNFTPSLAMPAQFFFGDMFMFCLCGGATSLIIKIEKWKKTWKTTILCFLFWKGIRPYFFRGGRSGLFAFREGNFIEIAICFYGCGVRFEMLMWHWCPKKNSSTQDVPNEENYNISRTMESSPKILTFNRKTNTTDKLSPLISFRNPFCGSGKRNLCFKDHNGNAR